MISTQQDYALPHVVEADQSGYTAADLVRAEKHRLRQLLRTHGAVLLRGFPVAGIDGFDQVVRSMSGAPLTYSERSSPRSAIKDRIYTSTDYPPDEEIFLHNENSYQSSWPRLLYFYCVQPPDTMGATPLADVRRVYAAIDTAVREEFSRRGWMLTRNFHDGLGVSWQYVFGSSDRAAVEEHCRRNRIALEWRADGSVRTTAIRDAIHVHPDTGEPLWFNHATFFHPTTLPADIRTGMLELLAEEDLPTVTYYGDGGAIPDDVVGHLRDCYRAASFRFDWRRGDILMVDNMLAAHGREPFTGQRQIAVAMAEPYPS
jgi:alpha-ketoglutarate-dependent taurine dioxygenase